jgi:S-adenosylmethionine:tRNA ribosyltransferase-isomerase
MQTADFDYELPEELIAQHPAAQRDAARMMAVDRASASWTHHTVRDLPALLKAGDLLVLNNTRVIPARLFGRKADTGGRVELLLLEPKGENTWEVLLRAGRRPRPGAVIELAEGRAQAEMLSDGERGRACLRISSTVPLPELLEKYGTTPLPPYISRTHEIHHECRDDRERYQTIYARDPGAVAAPTAGLHFTPALFEALEQRGIEKTFLTLHVGIGTFRPVTVETVETHRMDDERYHISEEAADKINRVRSEGRRIVAVGSTSVRTLENVADVHGRVPAGSGRTDLFIYPPYCFKCVDAMLTNFHLPRSTLLMMVCALAGRDLMLCAYRDAVARAYRFFSYGDCMLIS